MQADFGNGMETREYCECPTVEETGTVLQVMLIDILYGLQLQNVP